MKLQNIWLIGSLAVTSCALHPADIDHFVNRDPIPAGNCLDVAVKKILWMRSEGHDARLVTYIIKAGPYEGKHHASVQVADILYDNCVLFCRPTPIKNLKRLGTLTDWRHELK